MLNSSFINKLYTNHLTSKKFLPLKQITNLIEELFSLLFPVLSTKYFTSEKELQEDLFEIRKKILHVLEVFIEEDKLNTNLLCDDFLNGLPQVYNLIQQDIDAMFNGDPAAKSKEEVILTYPGFYAIASYRFAHLLLSLEVNILPRIITELAHSKTGIDIHPGAVIGHHFCIDHGTGVVIGETSNIGNNVKLYQGVTLGALSVEKKDADIKRHPTLEDYVVVYAGATILGGKTIIGKNSIVGGNVWVTKSIPENSKIYYQSKIHNSNTNETDLYIIKTDD